MGQPVSGNEPARGVRILDERSIQSTEVGRRFVAVIGINNYTAWPTLQNAVADAARMQRLLIDGFGFEAIPPLLNQEATRAAVLDLLESRLPSILREPDTVVLFFAGHGTVKTVHVGDMELEQGFFVPVDAHLDPQVTNNEMIRLDLLLNLVGELPARHVLLVLDSCSSGLALGPRVYRSRGGSEDPYLGSRRSRLVIVSARGDQEASDRGPVPGHSMFMSAIIAGLERAEADISGDGYVSSSELAAFAQNRVTALSESRQIPDFGRFSVFDDGGGIEFHAPGSRERPTEPPPAGARAEAEVPADLSVAIEYFYRGRLSAACPLLESLAFDELKQKDERRVALCLLTQILAREGRFGQLHRAVNVLLDLEPPMVIMDRSTPYAELLRTYDDARRARFYVQPERSQVKAIAVLQFSVYADSSLGVDASGLGMAARSIAVDEVLARYRTLVVEREFLGELVQPLSSNRWSWLDLQPWIVLDESSMPPPITKASHFFSGSIVLRSEGAPVDVLVTLWALNSQTGVHVATAQQAGPWSRLSATIRSVVTELGDILTLPRRNDSR